MSDRAVVWTLIIIGLFLVWIALGPRTTADPTAPPECISQYCPDY